MALVLMPVMLFAQAKEKRIPQRKGYILSEGNLKQGYILPRRNSRSYIECYFRKAVNLEDEIFSPTDIMGYGFENGESWKTVSNPGFNEGRPLFFLVLDEGRNNYYYAVSGKERAIVVISGEDTLLISNRGGRSESKDLLIESFSGQPATGNIAEGLQFNPVTARRVAESVNISTTAFVPRNYPYITAGYKYHVYILPKMMTFTLDGALYSSVMAPFFSINYNLLLSEHLSFTPGISFSQSRYAIDGDNWFIHNNLRFPLLFDYTIGRSLFIPSARFGIVYNAVSAGESNISQFYHNNYQTTRLGAALIGPAAGIEIKRQLGGKFNLAAGCIAEVMFDFNDHSLPAAIGVNTYISFGF